MLTEEELELMQLGQGGKTFRIGKRDLEQLAIGFGLLADGLIRTVGEQVDESPDAYWLVELTSAGRALLAEHTL